MRRLLKHFIIDTTTLYLVSQIVTGISFIGGMQTLFLTGAVLSLSQLILKPLINLLLLPLNLLTFGLFKWASYAITLYLVTLLVSGFKITSFYYQGLTTYWFNIPEVSLTGFLAFIAFSFIISSISSIIVWVMK